MFNFFNKGFIGQSLNRKWEDLTTDPSFKKAVQSTAGNSSIPVLESLPTLDASKAGQQFWFNGTLFTYAQANQFGTLPVGTPFPVKGYEELSFSFYYDAGQDALITNVRVNDMNIDVDGEFVRQARGIYVLSASELLFDTVEVIVNSDSAFEELFSIYANIDMNGEYNVAGVNMYVSDAGGASLVDLEQEYQRCFTTIKKYPPLS